MLDYVELDNNELREKGEQLANSVAELYKLRADKKDSQNHFKTLIDRKEKEISELTNVVRTGKELRSETFFDNQIED